MLAYLHSKRTVRQTTPRISPQFEEFESFITILIPHTKKVISRSLNFDTVQDNRRIVRSRKSTNNQVRKKIMKYYSKARCENWVDTVCIIMFTIGWRVNPVGLHFQLSWCVFWLYVPTYNVGQSLLNCTRSNYIAENLFSIIYSISDIIYPRPIKC